MIRNCYLCDFGLCKKLSNRSTTTTPCGTPSYLAPEVVKELPYDQNVDWWSFGILIFELTVGVVPFFSTSQFETFDKICNAPLRFPTWMEEDCKKLVGSLLQRKVSQRLGFLNDVDDIKAHQWFDDVDWDRMLQKKVVPPYHPDMAFERYCDEPPEDTITDRPSPNNEGMFRGFTFNGSNSSTQNRLRINTQGSSIGSSSELYYFSDCSDMSLTSEMGHIRGNDSIASVSSIASYTANTLTTFEPRAGCRNWQKRRSWLPELAE